MLVKVFIDVYGDMEAAKAGLEAEIYDLDTEVICRDKIDEIYTKEAKGMCDIAYSIEPEASMEE